MTLRRRGGRTPAAIALSLLATAVVAAGCTSASQAPATAAPRPTPQASLTGELAGTVAALTRALAGAGIRLDRAATVVQPSEPPGIAAAPRALLQADVRDADGGYVLVYRFADPATAASRGAEFRDYLESGPGQVNYPLDAQFALSQLGGTIVFTWWSPERAADRERAELAFETVAAVGQPIQIVK